MIHLTAHFAPSALFYHEDTPDFIRWLLEEAERCQEQGDLKEAERLAQEARESSREARAHVEHAAALTRLSEIYRQLGKLGPALRCARQTYDILQRQPGLVQRHNEAVAAYNLGLIHHLLGNEVDALNWYQTARRLFELAREFWAAHKDTQRVRACAQLERWIASLSGCLTHDRQRDGFHSSVIIPARLIGSGESFFSLAKLRVSGYLLGQQLVIGERSFQVHTLSSSGRPTLKERLMISEEEYAVFELPEPACSQVGAQAGDYVLAQRTERDDLSALCYVLEGKTGADFGQFARDPATGQVSFKSIVTGRVIGAMDSGDFVKYVPLALLRPAR